MVAVTLTRDLACATGTDAGNQSMRKNGRIRWNAEDQAIAASTTNRLLLHVPREHGGLGGVELPPHFLDGLGLTMDDVLKSGNKIRGHNGGPEEVSCSL